MVNSFQWGSSRLSRIPRQRGADKSEDSYNQSVEDRLEESTLGKFHEGPGTPPSVKAAKNGTQKAKGEDLIYSGGVGVNVREKRGGNARSGRDGKGGGTVEKEPEPRGKAGMETD